LSKNNQHGFSLLEILIAFTIMALSLGILLKIFSSGVITASVSEEYITAVQIAQSLMAKTGVETVLQPTQKAGIENDKYHWQVSVSPYDFNPEKNDMSLLPVQMYRLKVTVSWSDGDKAANDRQLELISLRLANKTL
jgi:general secretion pathway protein I